MKWLRRIAAAPLLLLSLICVIGAVRIFTGDLPEDEGGGGGVSAAVFAAACAVGAFFLLRPDLVLLRQLSFAQVRDWAYFNPLGQAAGLYVIAAMLMLAAPEYQLAPGFLAACIIPAVTDVIIVWQEPKRWALDGASPAHALGSRCPKEFTHHGAPLVAVMDRGCVVLFHCDKSMAHHQANLLYVRINPPLYVGITKSGRRRARELLAGQESRADGVEQRLLAEGLEQAIHGALREHPRPDVLNSVRRDEHDRNATLAAGQLTLQVGAAHAGHADVQNQALGAGETLRVEEPLGGRERRHREAERFQQPFEGLADGGIVVDYRNQRHSGAGLGVTRKRE